MPATCAFPSSARSSSKALPEPIRYSRSPGDSILNGSMGCTLHDLRRTIATGLERFGVRLEVTEAVLNHTGAARTVASVYQLHNYKDEKRAALAAWRTTFASAGHRPAVPTSPRFALDGNCLCRCHCVLRPAALVRRGTRQAGSAILRHPCRQSAGARLMSTSRARWAGAQRPTCSPLTRPGGSWRT
jgi:hypothetical protein